MPPDPRPSSPASSATSTFPLGMFAPVMEYMVDAAQRSGPIILTSRADSVRSRMASCAAAVLYADAHRRATALPTV